MRSQIQDSTYETLRPEQRVRAAVSATARGDDREIARLRETCPKYVYKMTDPAYADTMDKLMSLAAVIEADMRGHALDFATDMLERTRAKAKSTPPADVEEDRSDLALAYAAAVAEAWKRLLDELGIDRDEMERAGPPRHPMAWGLADMGEARASVEEELVGELLAAYRERLA